jgi:hypothetical protein
MVRDHTLDCSAYESSLAKTEATGVARCRFSHVRGVVGIRHTPRGKEVPGKRKELRIFLLSGMDAATFGSVLVHEVMHAWFSLNRVEQLPVKLEEGMCELMSYLWLGAVKAEV